MKLDVLYEDNHLIAVNKPAGMLIQGDDTGDAPLSDYVKAYIKEKYNKPGDVFLGTIHRIDRPVSGAVLFARTSKGLSRMNEIFRDRKIEKEYVAVCKSAPRSAEGQLEHFLVKDRSRNIVTAYKPNGYYPKDAKHALLNYTYLGGSGDYHLVEIELLTGRSHQIRVQLAQIGCVIRGDLKYGYPTPNDDGNISLHSLRMNFIHPVKKEPISIYAPPPKRIEWDVVAEFQRTK